MKKNDNRISQLKVFAICVSGVLSLICILIFCVLSGFDNISNIKIEDDSPVLSSFEDSDTQNRDNGSENERELDWIFSIKQNAANPNLNMSACAVLYNLKRVSYTNRIPYGYYNAWEQFDMTLKNSNRYRILCDDIWIPNYLDIEELGGLTFSEVCGGKAPSMNVADFFRFIGISGKENKEKNRASTIAIVKSTWNASKIIQCFSWHLENPYSPMGSGSNSYGYVDNSHLNIVSEILNSTGDRCCFTSEYPDGQFENPRAWYDYRLSEVAATINEFRDDKGNPIPIIFRLWHEVEDHWAWWQLEYCSIDEYKAFFSYTVDELNRLCNSNQIIFAFNSDRFLIKKMKCSDAYEALELICPIDKVDIVTFDDYSIGDSEEAYQKTVDYARDFSRYASDHGKLVAIAETGNNEDRTSHYAMLERLLNEEGVNLCYINHWRNAGLCGLDDVTSEMYEAMADFTYSDNIYTFETLPDFTKINKEYTY